MVFLPYVLIALIAASLTGCNGMRTPFTGLFGDSSPAIPAASAGETYYAAIDSLAVHQGPSGASAVSGHLALHERVVRTRVDHGYALITSSTSRLTGWVDNGKLVWKVQRPTEQAAPHAASRPQAPLNATSQPKVAAPARAKVSDSAPPAAAAVHDVPPAMPAPNTARSELAPNPPVETPAPSSPKTKAGVAHSPEMVDPF